MERRRNHNPIAGELLLIGIGVLVLVKAFYLREG
jgi:hypothetical protein